MSGHGCICEVLDMEPDIVGEDEEHWDE